MPAQADTQYAALNIAQKDYEVDQLMSAYAAAEAHGKFQLFLRCAP
jgi:hypothetical protein